MASNWPTSSLGQPCTGFPRERLTANSTQQDTIAKKPFAPPAAAVAATPAPGAYSAHHASPTPRLLIIGRARRCGRGLCTRVGGGVRAPRAQRADHRPDPRGDGSAHAAVGEPCGHAHRGAARPRGAGAQGHVAGGAGVRGTCSPASRARCTSWNSRPRGKRTAAAWCGRRARTRPICWRGT